MVHISIWLIIFEFFTYYELCYLFEHKKDAYLNGLRGSKKDHVKNSNIKANLL